MMRSWSRWDFRREPWQLVVFGHLVIANMQYKGAHMGGSIVMGGTVPQNGFVMEHLITLW